MADDRNYRDDEVRAIIERALNTQPDGGVSHEDLLAIGAGVGLSRAALEGAALEVREGRSNEAARARVVSRRRRAILAHAFVFSAVNALLFAINFLTTPGQWWVLFPVLVWGLALLLHAGFGLTRAVSPARLKRERRRIQEQQLVASSAPSALGARSGVRVAEAPPAPPAADAEQPPDAPTADPLARRGTRPP